MAQSELHKKGLEMRAELFGEKLTNEINSSTYQDPVMQKFRDVVAETIFGALWTRPGLDLKTRTLICVITDAATGRDPELELHVRMALRQGWTEDELTEVLLHMSGYVGVPLIREALLIASKVYAEVRAES
ncbi:MAG: carboxymuconolactone decarboxylase family protein [Gammaproteobacteria bacterium]|nr:carboxymuconolactone decarboxylase family protein [Gammaproteobacteria bacterium]